MTLAHALPANGFRGPTRLECWGFNEGFSNVAPPDQGLKRDKRSESSLPLLAYGLRNQHSGESPFLTGGRWEPPLLCYAWLPHMWFMHLAELVVRQLVNPTA